MLDKEIRSTNTTFQHVYSPSLSITLEHGTDPVSVRPYRYPQSQKTEIESLNTDLLHAGIMQPSYSAFSEPVLLVKKKDDS